MSYKESIQTIIKTFIGEKQKNFDLQGQLDVATSANISHGDFQQQYSHQENISVRWAREQIKLRTEERFGVIFNKIVDSEIVGSTPWVISYDSKRIEIKGKEILLPCLTLLWNEGNWGLDRTYFNGIALYTDQDERKVHLQTGGSVDRNLSNPAYHADAKFDDKKAWIPKIEKHILGAIVDGKTEIYHYSD